MTTKAGVTAERAVTRPYGEKSATQFSLTTAAESEGRRATGPSAAPNGSIGERFDADAGLQYLNARYYDPRLGMFVQPDWWEVTQAGVGTNRYSYSFNDPVNARDPSGNQSETTLLERLWAEFVSALRGGSKAAIAGMSIDVATPDPTDTAPQKWVGYAIVGGVAAGVLAVTNETDDDHSLGSDYVDGQGSIAVGDPGCGEDAECDSVDDPETENKIKHIFGNPEHRLDPLVREFGSERNAYRALSRAAQEAVKSGKISLKEGQVLRTSVRIAVGRNQVDLVGGKLLNGVFRIGTASMRDILP